MAQLPARMVRDDLLSALEAHLCDTTCEHTHVVLSACGKSATMTVDQDGFALAFKILPIDELTPYLSPAFAGNAQTGFKVVRVLRSQPLGMADNHACISDIPLRILVPRSTVEGLRSLAAVHSINLPAKKPKSFYTDALMQHECKGCPTLFYIVEPVATKKIRSSSTFVESNEPFHWETFEWPQTETFPPEPSSLNDIHRSLRDYCRELTPDVLTECGCAVCGQLVRVSDTVDRSDMVFKASILEQIDATRRERTSESDPEDDLQGPVLDCSLSRVCSSCLQCVQKGRRPKMALANNLWLGDVPLALKDLTWAEKALIARVRHNRCVVRISQGHSKMIGNVISFEHPTMKVYDKLPPPKESLHDIIAVIFTGMDPPSPEDLKRTPVLARRQKIKEALEWLVLNHKNYKSVKIDYDELTKYEDEGVPVTVIHKNMDLSEGNVLATAKSVFDNEDEIGSESGPCPYTVHGLTAERFSSMNSTQRKGAALQHLARGGHFLAVGHDPTPQSMYNNPALYPMMFPWLFPYGLGFIGHANHEALISYETHLQWLLMYHDKRFQMDPNFIIVTFNHHLIRQSTTGSFMMMKRSNFDRFVLTMKDLNTDTLYNIASRMRNGEYVLPQTPDEKRCFSLLDQVEYIGTSVAGGMAEKKFQRAELWSLLSFMNAPNWFITITPVDNKHPLCLYLSGTQEVFKPEIKRAGDRLRIISQNPVACARFFHYMVTLFIQHICGWSKDDSPKRGLFGKPSAYYGTVEQQGRLTLHLHFLLWIEGSPSPQTIRDRLLDDDEFQLKLVEYLESCQVEKHLASMEDDSDPTLTMPSPPPDTECDDIENCDCNDCIAVHSWCFAKKDNRRSSKQTKSDNPTPKVHPTGKGCLTENGHCTARFPREKFLKSKIHPKTGHVSLKKKEPMMNSITPVITKGYDRVISAMYDVWTNPKNASTEDIKDRDHVRKLVLKVVNSLTSKLELGAPFAAFRLLGYPERYTSHAFVLFYWKSYVNFVVAQHELQSLLVDPVDEDEEELPTDTVQDVGVIRVNDNYGELPSIELPKPGDENVQVFNTGKKLYNKSATDDYRLRPAQLESVSVYEWIQCSIKHRISAMDRAPGNLRFFKFHPDHPQHDTHVVACNPDKRSYMVPNFRGPPLPRRDDGDYEEYCCTMLTFFKPWRTGVDLKPASMTWEHAFDDYTFTDRQLQLMDNFNVRYECYDAKDDFYAMNKHKLGDDNVEDDILDEGEGLYVDEQNHAPESGLPTEQLGYASRRTEEANKKTRMMLNAVQWLKKGSETTVVPMDINDLRIRSNMSAADWKSLLNAEKKKAADERLTMVKALAGGLNPGSGEFTQIVNDVRVVPASYISRHFVPPEIDAATLMDTIVNDYGLNSEQERAFRIVANHSTCVGVKQLLMYMGGMGGTGKSRVIKAWVSFFNARNESYRCVLLGPTGTSAALIGGQTYHSFLSIGMRDPDDLVCGIDDLRERLMGVSYLIIDEVSMIGCLDLLRMSRRCQEALQSDEDIFGGLNIVLAGDFAQLPPPRGFSLYSREIHSCSPGEKNYLEYLGKSTWLQFTTAVILKKNMRQSQMSEEDEKFRTCLQNMRMKACTSDDIRFLQTLIAEFNADSLADVNMKEFRYAPILTALNSDKDLFNDILSDLFAEEFGENLHSFYSLDCLAPTRAERRARGKKAPSSKQKLSSDDQLRLWNQAPHTSNQIPGKLRLCIGMPVIIRYNVATELCITRGQEATVLGWTSSPVPGYRDLRTLDVLYVKLKDPPKTVRIPGLPDNVVPLGRQKNTIDARLPSDKFLHITRSQVPILPCFSITDFGAQGKGIERCRMDLLHSRNHQAMYVSLSRATSAKGVLILRDFPVDKITGGLDGSLRQEFRELNYLDEITRLQYEDQLPSDIIALTRPLTIANYRRWKGNSLENTWHPSLQGGDEHPLEDTCERVAGIANAQACKTATKGIVPTKDANNVEVKKTKRKNNNDPTGTCKRRKILQTRDMGHAICDDDIELTVEQVDNGQLNLCGPQWDANDHSCAFDSWSFIFYSLWLTSPSTWSALKHQSALLNTIHAELPIINKLAPESGLIQFRDLWRSEARRTNPTNYMATNRLVDIVGLSMHIQGFVRPSIRTKCRHCSSVFVPPSFSTLCIGSFMTLERFASVQAFIDVAHEKVCDCLFCGAPMYNLHTYPSSLCLQIIHSPAIQIDPIVLIPGSDLRYRLCGIVYYANAHFTSRAILPNNSIYYHDGLSGSNALFEGVLHTDLITSNLNEINGKMASIAFYVFM
ncbi:hypothetical protein CVT24_002414 [Panaeolus cyanescens]|uniref:ATP-dependent DNA helicase n=1 Tax=Panaeolus cyanescens TaxID=181874 RepID=A0A409W123_9AGAR|nr:hypothetical protein CVT24_002414 [Panaeolus cyanescens]